MAKKREQTDRQTHTHLRIYISRDRILKVIKLKDSILSINTTNWRAWQKKYFINLILIIWFFKNFFFFHRIQNHQQQIPMLHSEVHNTTESCLISSQLNNIFKDINVIRYTRCYKFANFKDWELILSWIDEIWN